jgi:hypothetical protein
MAAAVKRVGRYSANRGIEKCRAIVDAWQMPGAVPRAGSCAAASQAKTVHDARIPATSTKNAVVPVFLFANARRFAHPA